MPTSPRKKKSVIGYELKKKKKNMMPTTVQKRITYKL